MTESADLIAGRYRLDARIGAGGMGVVWRARDEVLGRTVAVKELTTPSAISLGRGDDNARRALREARIAARLHHPNVIGIYDVVVHEDRPVLIMEYLASRSLSQLLANGELLSPARAAHIGVQLAAALTAAHEAGIVHRDVKPGNVLLGDDGSVKLTDFGISRAVGDTTVTASGIMLGTLGYIAPETAQGQSADARSDVYALGATLYAAVEGHAPFSDADNAVALMYRIVHEEIIPATHAGPLEPLLLWMLARDPALRPTMPQVRRSLEVLEAASEDEGEDPPDAAPTPTPAVTEAVTETAPATTTPPPVAPPPSATPPPSAGIDDDDHGNDDVANVPHEQPERRRTRRALIGVLIAAVLLALGGWALAASLTHRPTSLNAGSSTSATATSTATTTHAASSSSSSASPLSPSSHPANGATSAPPSSTPASPTSQDVAAQLVSTIVDYYKLVPGNLDQGWTWLTAYYQTHHAGGRSGYQLFWSQIQSVTASNVTASPPSTAEATIDYYYKNGTVVEERTEYGLVFQQGRWKIASSPVLSSQTR